MVELNDILDAKNGNSNGKHTSTYKLPSNIDGEQIVKVDIVEQITNCDALLSETGAFHLSQRSKCAIVPPIREILATEPYGNTSCCCKSDTQTPHLRPPINIIRFAGDEPIPTNHIIVDLHNQVRDIYETASVSIQYLKDWIILRVPKVEDGNNFGVEVQEKCLLDVTNAMATIKSAMAQLCMGSYSRDRMEFYVDMCRLPQMDDAKHRLKEADMTQFTYCRNYVLALRDLLIGVHHNVAKNIAKVREPKPKNDMFENYCE
jgi:hypothetical protein